jgi:serine/threonine protein kinase
MHELEINDVISGGVRKFQIVHMLGQPGGQSYGYKAMIVGSTSSKPEFAFIKQYHDLNLTLMGRLDLFFQVLAKRIPPSDEFRICLPLNDSRTDGRYQPAIGEAGNTIFIAFRWIEGKTLGDWMKQGQHSDEEKKRAILAVLHICRTLSRSNIVHLDLKLDNFLINDFRGRDNITLIDMDLARIQEQAGIYSGVRGIGGTHCYAAGRMYSPFPFFYQ